MRMRGALAVGFLLCFWGCSFVLDPEECTSSADCEDGQSCRSGICLGPVIPTPAEDVGLEASTPDVELPDIAMQPVDMAVDLAVQPDMRDMEVPPRGPACEITEPATAELGPIAAERLTVRGVVGDPDSDEATEVTATLSGMAVALAADGTFSADVALAEGPNVIVLSAQDETGLTCDAQVRVTVDRTAPVLRVLVPNGDRPANPSENPFRISGTITEEGGVAAIEVSVNGGRVAGPAAAAGDFSFLVELVEGDNQVEVIAIDQAGNRSAPVQRTLTLDSEAPTVTIDRPVAGMDVVVDRIEVAGRVTSDGVGERRSQLEVTLNGVDFEPDPNTADDAGDFAFEVPLVVGENRIRVGGNDLADNFGFAEVRVTRTNPAPCVAIEAPVEGAFVGAAALALSGTVCPAVTEVEVRIDEGMPRPGVVAAGRFTADVVLPAGRRSTVTVKALTPAGDFAEDTVGVFFDNSGPTVSINAPQAGRCLNAALIAVSGQVEDAQSGIAEVTVNGTNAEVVGSDYRVELPLPEGGNQPIRIVAENRAGLRTRLPLLGQPEHLVNIDRTAPTINLQNGDDVPWLRPDGAGEIVLRGSLDGGTCAALSARIERLCAGDDPVDAGCVAQPQEVGIQGDGSFVFRRAFPEGRQRGVLIRTTDTAGNQGERRYAFRVDGTAPQVIAVTPGGFTRSPTVQICLTARDTASGVQQIRIGDRDAVIEVVGGDRRGCLDVPLVEGENRTVVEALDLVGNRVGDEVVFTLDTTAPQVALTYPAEGGAVAVPALVEGTIQDGEAGSGPGVVRVNGVAAVVNREAGTWRAGGVPIDPQDPVLVVTAQDQIGNEIQALRRVVSIPDYIDQGARTGFGVARGIGWLGITDADLDGQQDIIALSDQAGGVSAIYTQQTDNTFRGRSAQAVGVPDGVPIRAAALGDLDADGTFDLVLSATGSTGAYIGQGDGTFRLVNSGIPANVVADGLTLGDINRDGTLDLLLFAAAATRVQTNIGGTFNTQPLADFNLASVVDARRGLFVDVTGDQVLDLVTVGPNGSRLLRGTLGGPFQAVAGFESLAAERIGVLDADRDGALDLFTSGVGAGRFYLSDAGGFITGLAGLDLQPGDRGLTAADLDGDARDDVVVFGDGGLRSYRGTDLGFTAHDFGLPVVAAAVHALAITDLDADGDFDLVYAGPAGVGLITSNLSILQPDRLYARVDVRRGLEAAAGPADAVGVVIAHEYEAGLQRLIPAQPAAPTLVTLSGDDVEVQVRFIDLGAAGGASRSLPALVAEPGTIFGPE